jgi:glucose-1-phosphate thymidylyltransferase
MKGVILCAGEGTRLRPLTYTGAKHLIPVANEPILFLALNALVEAGITDIALVVGTTGWQIKDTVGDGAQFGCRVEYIPQERPLGLGHAVRVTRDFVGDSPFVVYLGDNYIHGGIRRFTERFRETAPDAQILLSREVDPFRFGVADVRGRRIVRVVERPKQPPSNLCIVGVYAFSPAVFDAIAKTPPSARGEIELTDAIQHLIDQGLTVSGAELETWWKDTGKPDDVLDLNRRLLEGIEESNQGDVDGESIIEGRVWIGTQTLVRRSLLRGPIIIGDGCVIEDAYVGPFTSVGPRSEIRAAEIENSVLLPHCVVQGVEGRIDSSLLGAHVRLTRSRRRPIRHKMVLADQSQIQLP